MGLAWGGELTGTWRFADSCAVDPDSPISNCRDSTYDVEVQLEGMVTCSADMTFEPSGTQSADYVAVVPGPCTAILELKDCDALRDEVFGGVGSCEVAGDGCECTGPFFDEIPLDLAGTWATDGSEFTVTIDGVGDVAGTFCVEGDTLSAIADGSPFVNVAVMQ